MIGTIRRAGLLGLLLALIGGSAWAEVTLTFYAHPGARVRDGNLLFPHAFVQATGTLEDTGDTVDWAAGSRRSSVACSTLAGWRGRIRHGRAKYRPPCLPMPPGITVAASLG